MRGALGAVVCVVACWVGAITATAEAFLTPLYLFGVRFPLAAILAVVFNPLLVWGTHRLTGWRVGALLPGEPTALLLTPGVAWIGTTAGLLRVRRASDGGLP